MEDRYYRFSRYLYQRFGCKVYKISVDAGFSCPNRDGRIGTGGCIYCDNRGFSYNTRLPVRPLREQIEDGISYGKTHLKAERFIVYFQAYTNTYAPLEVLQERYSIVRAYPEVVGIAIGTRPDCVDKGILSLINGYTQEYEVWMEYGLQSIHNGSLVWMGRGHLYSDFLKAVELTRSFPQLKICAHVIIGLPGEDRDMVVETAREVARLQLDGVKIHPLHIIKGTSLEELYKKGRYVPLEVQTYVELVVEFLKYLWQGTVIQRLTATCPKDWLVAPLWINDRNRIIQLIQKRMEEEDVYQGCCFVKEVQEGCR